MCPGVSAGTGARCCVGDAPVTSCCGTCSVIQSPRGSLHTQVQFVFSVSSSPCFFYWVTANPWVTWGFIEKNRLLCTYSLLVCVCAQLLSQPCGWTSCAPQWSQAEKTDRPSSGSSRVKKKDKDLSVKCTGQYWPSILQTTWPTIWLWAETP